MLQYESYQSTKYATNQYTWCLCLDYSILGYFGILCVSVEVIVMCEVRVELMGMLPIISILVPKEVMGLFIKK